MNEEAHNLADNIFVYQSCVTTHSVNIRLYYYAQLSKLFGVRRSQFDAVNVPFHLSLLDVCFTCNFLSPRGARVRWKDDEMDKKNKNQERKQNDSDDMIVDGKKISLN